MKWDKLKKSYPHKRPKFFSKCNWLHRDYWWRDIYYDLSVNASDVQPRICKKCQIYWEDKESITKDIICFIFDIIMNIIMIPFYILTFIIKKLYGKV